MKAHFSAGSVTGGLGCQGWIETARTDDKDHISKTDKLDYLDWDGNPHTFRISDLPGTVLHPGGTQPLFEIDV